MIIAGFDIATTTGCAILDGSRVLHVEAFRPDGKTDAEVFHGFRAWFRKTLQQYPVEHVAIEQALVTDIRAPVENGKPGETRNPVQYRTYLRLYGLRAIAIQSAHGLGMPLIEVHQGTWRKAFTGNGRASKEESLALAQKIVPGLKSLDAAEAIGIAWHLNGVIRHQTLMGAAECQTPQLPNQPSPPEGTQLTFLSPEASGPAKRAASSTR